MARKLSVSRLATVVIVLAAVAGAAYWWLRPSPPAPATEARPVTRPARTMTLGQVEGPPVRSFPGRVQAGRGRRVDVAFRVPGTIIEFPVKADQSVAQGQLLARLDPRDFETRLAQASSAVVEARARLTAMQTGDRPEDIRILESQLAAEQARLREAELEFTRTRNLFERGAATGEAFDRATRAFEVAQASTAAAATALARGRSGARVEDIEAQRALIGRLESQQREARHAFEDTRLTAPFAGTVARTLAENFQEVQARQPIVSLRDASGLEIVADVPEFVMVQISNRSVMSLVAAFDFLPGRTFPLTYSEAEAEADPRTRTFAVVLRLMSVPSDVRLLPGMTATVLVEPAPAATGQSDQWPVPAAAIAVDAEGKRYVWRVDREKQTVRRVPVEAGEVRGDQVIVRGALQRGDTIVTAGVNHLQEGDKIRPVPPGEAGIR